MPETSMVKKDTPYTPRMGAKLCKVLPGSCEYPNVSQGKPVNTYPLANSLMVQRAGKIARNLIDKDLFLKK